MSSSVPIGDDGVTEATTELQSSTISQPKFLEPKIVSKPVNDYALKYGFREDPVATELRHITADHPRSRMMGDPNEAAFFSNVLMPAMNAKKIVEIGVFTGYTTLQLAKAVGEDGTVLALDVSDEFTCIGKPYWKKAGVADRIQLIIAPAVETLQKILDDGQAETFDFVFIDADKVHYGTYYELSLQLLRKNGIVAIDNTLWGGKVLDEQSHQDNDTDAIRAISKHVMTDDRVDHVLLPFADGVTLVRKC
ncbi:O-methyltransferase [Nitzschia inconspicua]|uniref:O-methyltransferase n=1 Tax=Nitzschia inconspicua TaxID=303405 RepID=A0A9K3PFN5_9STRA|nr:O-methyltransferase [Nitzschia inconspicua]